MKVLIYGGGAVGLSIASCLIKSGAEVDILARENTVASLRTHGLVRTGILGSFHAAPEDFHSYVFLQDIPPTIYDYILVCTKSYDSDHTAEDIACYNYILDEGTRIVLFQNGWGNAEKFTPFFPAKRIYHARVITGFTRPKLHEVLITVHAEAIHIGSLFHSNLSEIAGLCQRISSGGIPCEPYEHIEKDLWAKMLYNCALNGLGAILRVPYGLLGEYEYSRRIMKGIVEEIYEVMRMAGYTTHWESAQDYLKTFYERLIPATAQHESSTLQDIRSNKRTEIDALNGAIIRLAEQFGIDAPRNLMIYDLVKFIETGNVASSLDTHGIP